MLVSVRNLPDRLLSITDAMYDPSATAVVAAVLMALGPNSGNDTMVGRNAALTRAGADRLQDTPLRRASRANA